MTTMDIKDKINKLLNMTVANGCSEDEQEVAMRMAASLATKHGIELESVRPKDAPRPTAKLKRRTDELKPHQAFCARAAAALYGIECVTYNLGHEGLHFVGREDLIEVTEQTMMWLFRQVETLYKEALPKGMTQQRRAEFRKTFKAACAKRTLERAQAHMHEMRTNERTAQEATGSNALVVAGYFATLKSEIEEFWAERQKGWDEQRAKANERLAAFKATLTPEALAQFEREEKKRERAQAKRTGRRGRSMPVGVGTQAGYAAGDRVQLRKEVG